MHARASTIDRVSIVRVSISNLHDDASTAVGRERQPGDPEAAARHVQGALSYFPGPCTNVHVLTTQTHTPPHKAYAPDKYTRICLRERTIRSTTQVHYQDRKYKEAIEQSDQYLAACTSTDKEKCEACYCKAASYIGLKQLKEAKHWFKQVEEAERARVPIWGPCSSGT